MMASTKPKRNAVARALELGIGGKSLEDIQRNLRRPRSINLGEDGLVAHCDELDDEEVVAILTGMETSGEAYRRNVLWYPRRDA